MPTIGAARSTTRCFRCSPSRSKPSARRTAQAIAAHFRDRKFKILVGEVELPGQILDKVYTVGQWQGGFFNAVNGEGFSNYAQVKLKTSWG